MRDRTRSGIEVLLAGIAVATVSTFTACGGGVESTSSNGGSGSAGSSGSSSGKGPVTREGGVGMDTCENGKDPLCGCSLPGEQSSTHAFVGPTDAGPSDAGEGSDAGAWRCEDECEEHHPNRNGTLEECSFTSASGSSGSSQVTCTYYVRCVGRRPAEMKEPTLGSVEARDLLVATARLEEASIAAFVRLARELAHHRAPTELVARAREAARDEVRHTRAMSALAVRFGADSARNARTRAQQRRTPRLVDILIENAVEGCVRETFGALMAHVQAQLASDPVVRDTMTEIAVDESRHAALAWAIDAWGSQRVSARDRRRIVAARAQAVRSLVSEIEGGPRAVDGSELGLVGAIEARALAASLETHLWAA